MSQNNPSNVFSAITPQVRAMLDRVDAAVREPKFAAPFLGEWGPLESVPGKPGYVVITKNDVIRHFLALGLKAWESEYEQGAP